MKKVGIITFHNSYNCGSMLESYAMQKTIQILGCKPEIIDFSSKGQSELYSVLVKMHGIKDIIKNVLLLPHYFRIKNNNKLYESFKKRHFILSEKYSTSFDIQDLYDVVVAGSDQIWNITIPDYDDAYFLNWVDHSKRVAYAPSFGAKNIISFANDVNKYKHFLERFDCLSVRERNGQKWIMDICGEKAEIVADPTLLLSEDDYAPLEDLDLPIPKKDYIFFYCPSFDKNICSFVKKISQKYNLDVVTWSTKSYYLRFVSHFGFTLVKEEDPSKYLTYIKNAKLVITTSFHGTIFSTVYHKNFFTIKNGEMYDNDDRVITLMDQLGLNNRLISFEFCDDINYLEDIDYARCDFLKMNLKEKSINYLQNALVGE